MQIIKTVAQLYLLLATVAIKHVQIAKSMCKQLCAVNVGTTSKGRMMYVGITNLYYFNFILSTRESLVMTNEFLAWCTGRPCIQQIQAPLQ